MIQQKGQRILKIQNCLPKGKWVVLDLRLEQLLRLTPQSQTICFTSGKGTQCELLVEKYGISHISTGDLLRAEVKNGTDVGKKVEESMGGGKLVADDIIIGLVEKTLSQEKKGWVLDGFPRTTVQMEALKKPTHLVVLDITDEVVIDRMSGRRVDPETRKIYHIKHNPPPPEIADRVEQRKDDNEETIKTRLQEYHKYLDEILELADNMPVVRVDGSGDKHAVFNQMVEKLEKSKL